MREEAPRRDERGGPGNRPQGSKGCGQQEGVGVGGGSGWGGRVEGTEGTQRGMLERGGEGVNGLIPVEQLSRGGDVELKVFLKLGYSFFF